MFRTLNKYSLVFVLAAIACLSFAFGINIDCPAFIVLSGFMASAAADATYTIYRKSK